MIEDGLERHLDPGTPEITSGDIAGTVLPLTLGDAITAFRADEYLFNTMPDPLTSVFLELKQDEWARYCSVVTQLEFDQYWEAIP
jgi:glutamine synthetase